MIKSPGLNRMLLPVSSAAARGISVVVSRRLIHSSSRVARAAELEARSIIYEANGDPTKILRAHKWALPEPKSGQVVLRVGLASINPADINVLQGVYPAKPAKRQLPGLAGDAFIGGNEGFGIVEHVADAGGDLQEGDWVVFGKPQMGTWTSRMVCAQDDVIKINRRSSSSSLTEVMASTLQVNPATALRMLSDFQRLQPGDVVVQNAANSAVGQAVVQIAARQMGVETINLVRDRPKLDEMAAHLAALAQGGAPAHLFTYEGLDDRDSGVKEKIKDIVGKRKIKLGLNAVCGKDGSNMAKLMGPDSTLVTYGAMSKQPLSVPVGLVIFLNMSVQGFMMNKWYASKQSTSEGSQERRQLMDTLTKWYEDGSLVPPESHIVHIAPSDDVETVGRKAREAVGSSMAGYGGKKLFFKFD